MKGQLLILSTGIRKFVEPFGVLMRHTGAQEYTKNLERATSKFLVGVKIPELVHALIALTG